MLSKIGRLLRGYFVVVGVLVTIILFWGALSIPTAKPNRPITLPEDERVLLELPLEGPILQAGGERGIWQRLMGDYWGQKPGPYILDVRHVLRKAKDDPRVTGIFLRLHHLTGSLSDFSELRRLLFDFKASGKPIHAWASYLDTNALLLASVADQVSVAPLSHIQVTGPGFYLTYFASALSKLGLGVDVIRVGRYKSFGEPFIQDQPSTETREFYRSLRDSIQQSLVAAIGAGRGKDPAQARGWLKRGFFTSSEAADVGMVDAVSYLDGAKEALSKAAEGKYLKLSKYQRVLAADQSVMGAWGESDGIALIEAIGEIRMVAQGREPGVIDPDRMIKELEWAKKKDSVKAVVLRINSPGGSAVAADLIWQKVKELADTKSVVVSIGSVAASGGYYIAAPAQKIFIEKLGLTGSIGVFAMLPNGAGVSKKFGISFHAISDSDRVDLLNPGKRLSAEDRAVLQVSVDDTYEQFLDRVAKGRQMTRDRVHEAGQGRVWTGTQALENGLVDAVGGLHEALQAAKELAELDVDGSYPLYRYTPPIRSLTDCLMNARSLSECVNMATQTRSESPWLRAHDRVRWLESLTRDPVQALWPQGMDLGNVAR